MEINRTSLAVILACTALTNLLIAWGGRPAIETAPDPLSDHSIARAVSNTVQDVATRVSPAVVGISCTGHRGAPRSGSGVILSAQGLVVTNNHVVAGARRILVRLLDGRTFEAELRGTDADSDLALLDLEGSGFPHVELSSGPTPEVGTWVLAIGNPLGLDHTVTLGIISARGRSGIDIATYEDFLQTDAAINAGNSGGPLLDLEGKIVGINTAVEVISSGSQGLGFAIPASMVRDVVEDLSEKGYVERGYFGIKLAPVGSQDSARVGLERGRHVRVFEVEPGTPAAAAGIRQNDILLAIAGEPIRSTRQVFDAIAQLDPGARVSVDLWRDGKPASAVISVGNRNDFPPK